VSKYRKYILLAIFGAMVCYSGSDWLLGQFSGPLASLEHRKVELRHEIRQVERQLDHAHKTAKEMDLWKAQSLPSDVEQARSAYREWLLELVGHVQFVDPNVDSGEPVNRKGMAHATSLSFSLRARGTLAQLTRFLYDFYSAGHLHQIRSLSITPVQGTEALDLAISIEALVLPNARSCSARKGPTGWLPNGSTTTRASSSGICSAWVAAPRWPIMPSSPR